MTPPSPHSVQLELAGAGQRLYERGGFRLAEKVLYRLDPGDG